MQLAFERGLLVLGTHNVTLAHTSKIQKQIIAIYFEVFREIEKAIVTRTLKKVLKVKPLKPLFKVR